MHAHVHCPRRFFRERPPGGSWVPTVGSSTGRSPRASSSPCGVLRYLLAPLQSILNRDCISILLGCSLVVHYLITSDNSTSKSTASLILQIAILRSRAEIAFGSPLFVRQNFLRFIISQFASSSLCEFQLTRMFVLRQAKSPLATRYEYVQVYTLLRNL